MRRAIIQLAASLLTFSAGLLAHGLWPEPAAKPGEAEATTVSLCELVRNSERYDGKLVRVRAELYKDLSPFIYDWSCGPPDARTSPLISIGDTPGGISPSWAVSGLFCAGSDPLRPRGPASAEVVVVGTFEADSFVPGASAGARHPVISPRSISQPPPPAAGR